MTKFVAGFFQFLWAASLLGFIAIKVGGVTFAAWSWWWILLPQIPVLAEIAKRFGV